MSTIKTDALTSVTTNTDLTLSANGTGGVKVSDYFQLTKGADISSATSLTLGTDGNAFDVTGTTTITSIATQGIGSHITLHFDGALTFTHHSTNLILPGAANITTAAGDIAVMYEYASADWRCVSYTKASGAAVVASGAAAKNFIINGGMKVAQRGASFATLTASEYTLDRWEWIDSGTTAGAVTITQDTDVPTIAQAGIDLQYSLKIDCTTAEDLGGADAALYLSHKIEARDCIIFGHGGAGALDATLSFWFKSTKTGIFTVNVDRNDASEKYSTEFTVATTNTWEQHTVTVPGDTDGTAIVNDNGIGLAIQFMIAVGGDGDTSTADAWNASGATELATSNQVNLLDSTSNNVLITGVQFEIGSSANAFDYLSFPVELTRCNRYYSRLSSNGEYLRGHGLAVNTANVAILVPLYVKMRGDPTIHRETTMSNYNVWDGGSNVNPTGITLQNAGQNQTSLYFAETGSSPFTQFRSYGVSVGASGWIAFDAEL